MDTVLQKEDHLNEFTKKHIRFQKDSHHKEVTMTAGSRIEYADNPILPSLIRIDRGLCSVNCATNLSSLESKDVTADCCSSSEIRRHRKGF